MKENSKIKGKGRRRKRITINPIRMVAFLFVLYFGYTLFNQQLKINKYNSQIAMYEQEIEAKQNLVAYYTSTKDNISSEEYIESVAREKLGLVKPYETVYVDASK